MNYAHPATAEQCPDHTHSESSLQLTVVFTTVPGTAAALARASQLARDLRLNLTLLVPQVVPYQVPLTSPPVAISHTQQMALSLVSEFALNVNDTRVQICLCRDQLECLSRLITAPSIVFLGGQNSSWWRRERRLARGLRALGHEVIFVDQKERRHARSVLRCRWSSILRGVLGFRQSLRSPVR
ncbi:MAG TPA: hypothetical protein VMT20_11555 [Terriglobia bacterium]|nr:hypothetical protein [Terriglobia bacterium]